MKKYKVVKGFSKKLLDDKFFKLEEGKKYEWEFEYKLEEGNEKSSSACIVFLNKNKNRTVVRRRLFKKDSENEIIKSKITFIALSDMQFAQCGFYINALHYSEDRGSNTVELPDIKESEIFKVSDDEEESFDDIFDFNKQYEKVDLDKEPWEAIGGQHNKDLKKDNISKKITLLKVKYNLNPDSKILDIGCGTGDLLDGLKDYLNSNDNYVGIDLAQRSVDFCKEKFPEYTFLKGKMTAVPGLNNKFDFICLFNVITHIHPEDITKLLNHLKQYLTANGVVIVTTIINDKITTFSGDKSRIEMNKLYFYSLMEEAGYSYIENLRPLVENGHVIFALRS